MPPPPTATMCYKGLVPVPCSRSTLNLIVDLLTGLAMLGLIVTGLMMRYVLPPGTGGRLRFWGLGRHDWGDLHFYLAVAILAVALIHIALHWNWVCQMFRNLFRPSTGATRSARMRLAAGIITLLAVIVATAAFILYAKTQVGPDPNQGIGGGGRHWRGGQ